ncbi:MAG: MurT ligase domain-containing protein, partial [Candidatus Saccharimonadales bacterium]
IMLYTISNMLPRLLVIWVGKILIFLGRIKGGGSSLPGLVVEKLQPNFIQYIPSYFDKIIVVTGTNGKTTTTKVLRDILQEESDSVVSNQSGSNMPRGIITSVISAMDWTGKLQAKVGLFEVDEGFTTYICKELEPEVLAILNLHRDQLDRYGELDRIINMLYQAAKSSKFVVVNVDDLRLRDAFREFDNTTSVSALLKVRMQVPNDDQLHASTFNTVKKEEDYPADIIIKGVNEHDDGQEVSLNIRGVGFKVKTKLQGVFNAYNVAVAIAIASDLGAGKDVIKNAIADFEPAFGRSEVIKLKDKDIKMLLVKNPSGFNQTIAGFLNKQALPTLIIINDNYADSRDVSWLWDVDIEGWSNAASSKIIVSGTRAHDMALRLQYADIEYIIEPDIKKAIIELTNLIPRGGTGNIVPTYTAMLKSRKLLKSKIRVKV